MSTFKGLPESDKNPKTPFDQMAFWQWLSNDPVKDYHAINTKTRYLESLGFIKGTDKLTSQHLTNLRYCLQHHYDTFERPLNGVRFAYDDKIHNIRHLLLKRLSSYIVSGRITAKQYQKRVHTLNLWALRKLK